MYRSDLIQQPRRAVSNKRRMTCEWDSIPRRLITNTLARRPDVKPYSVGGGWRYTPEYRGRGAYFREYTMSPLLVGSLKSTHPLFYKVHWLVLHCTLSVAHVLEIRSLRLPQWTLTGSQKKGATVIFSNNSVKHWTILINFGKQYHKEISHK